jgi:hypothetical protein
MKWRITRDPAGQLVIADDKPADLSYEERRDAYRRGDAIILAACAGGTLGIVAWGLTGAPKLSLIAFVVGAAAGVAWRVSIADRVYAWRFKRAARKS